jgi:hypothetical protein
VELALIYSLHNIHNHRSLHTHTHAHTHTHTHTHTHRRPTAAACSRATSSSSCSTTGPAPVSRGRGSRGSSSRRRRSTSTSTSRKRNRVGGVVVIINVTEANNSPPIPSLLPPSPYPSPLSPPPHILPYPILSYYPTLSYPIPPLPPHTLPGWTKGVNMFSDLTAAERRAYMGGDKRALHANAAKPANLRAEHLKASGGKLQSLDQLPASVDWRNIPNTISAVKDQGQCGSCWAFAAAETIESHVAINTGILNELSMQELVSAVLCCAVLCYAMLCCAMLCCAILCYAVLRCAVLFCAVLCCAFRDAFRDAHCLIWWLNTSLK